MSSQYGELGLLAAEICWRVWGTPANATVSRLLAFVTAATSLTGGQPDFARCLAVSWAATLYTFSEALIAPWQNFTRSKIHLITSKSRVLVILAALLHGTPAAGVSQTLRCGTRNGITELSQKAPPIFGRAAITLDIGPYSSYLMSKSEIGWQTITIKPWFHVKIKVF